METANKYINRIKNYHKRSYAAAYLSYRVSGGAEPERGEVSYMAAQCVRMNIDKLIQ